MEPEKKKKRSVGSWLRFVFVAVFAYYLFYQIQQRKPDMPLSSPSSLSGVWADERYTDGGSDLLLLEFTETGKILEYDYDSGTNSVGTVIPDEVGWWKKGRTTVRIKFEDWDTPYRFYFIEDNALVPTVNPNDTGWRLHPVKMVNGMPVSTPKKAE